jgi:hypothetical protein
MDMPQEQQGIVWTVQTHEHKERSVDWYWGLGLIALAGAVASVFFGNYMFAAIIAIAGSSIGILVARGPREHEVRLTPRGLSLDGTLYRWDTIDSFWVEYADQTHVAPRLLVATRGFLHPQLVIPLESGARAQAVRSYMKKFAEEEKQHPHIGTHLAEMFGL